MQTAIYPIFYKTHGIRYLSTLASPNPTQVTALPVGSCVHYLDSGDIVSTQPYLAAAHIAVDYILKLTQTTGHVTTKTVQLNTLKHNFQLRHHEFRYVENPHLSIRDGKTLIIYGYNYIADAYKYTDVPMVDYNKRQDLYSTVWAKVAEVCSKSDRQHFIFFTLPDPPPSKTMLDMFAKKDGLSLLKVFNTDDKLFTLDLWRWLNPEFRSMSTMACLQEPHLNKINIVMTSPEGKSTVLNLAYLYSWIKGNPSLLGTKVQQLPLESVQKTLLKSIMSLEVKDDELLKAPAEPGDLTLAAVGDLSEGGELEDAAITDEDLAVLDVINKKDLKQRGVHLDDKGEVSEVEDIIEQSKTFEELAAEVMEPKSHEDTLKAMLDAQADYGLVTASEFKKLSKELGAYGALQDPYKSKERVSVAMVVSKEDLALSVAGTTMTDTASVFDKSMLSSSLMEMDSRYISNVIRKDMLSSIAAVQSAGVIVKNHEIKMEHSVMGSFEAHSLELKPLDGVTSTIRFKVPIVSLDGTYTSGGSKYSLRRQRVDVPLRKIDPNTVALTTYYGKNFVSRSVKKVDDSLDWLIRAILREGVTDGSVFKNVNPGSVFDSSVEAPFIYNGLGTQLMNFERGGYYFSFNFETRAEMLSKVSVPVSLESIELNKDRIRERWLVGIHTASGKRTPVVMGMDNDLYLCKDGTYVNVGDIYQVLEVDQKEVPVDFSEVRIYSKKIPVGVCLGYFIGFKNLLTLLKAEYRTVPTKSRNSKAEMLQHEYMVIFQDETYIFSRRQATVSLVVAGYLDFEKVIKKYPVSEFNKKDVYFNLFATKSITALYIRELETTNQLFVDPISKSILEDMGIPATFQGMLLESTKMLTTYHHPDPQDMNMMRIRGYERIPGIVYKELCASIRGFRNRNISGRSKIEMSPYQIWSTIMSDQSAKIVEDINPIQNLKESEAVTYAGEGGRTEATMNKKSRAYHPNDIGVISEATVDSSSVGVNTYLSSNPNFSSLRGMVKENKTINGTSMMSTSANLSVGVDRDDNKRVNFISIQQAHTVAAKGYTQPQVRTGYESVIAHRTSEMFATTAKQDGKVISISKHGILVEYTDGTRKGVNLGRVFGKAEGSVYPHDITTFLKEGESFKKGTPLAYNSGFFEPNFLNPKEIIMKASMVVKVALLEGDQTYEDSCAISSDLSSRMSVNTTKVKSIVVNFNQNLREIHPVGSEIKPKDILCLIEDEITSTTSAFDEESLAILKKLGSQAPYSKYNGTLDRIEVYYHGDKADMSPSLLSLTEKSDKLLRDRAKASGEVEITGAVTSDYRVGGTPLALDRAEVKFYITIGTSAGVGDKGVFSLQLKSTIGEVMHYDMTTEDGEKIDAVFGYKSINARIVLSPTIIGTTTTLLKVIAKKAVEIYKK